MEFATLLFYLMAFIANLVISRIRYQTWNRAIIHPVNLMIVFTGGVYIGPMLFTHLATDATLGLINLAILGLFIGNLLYQISPHRRVLRGSVVLPYRFRLMNYAFLLTVLLSGIFALLVVRSYDLRQFSLFYAKSKIGTAWVYIFLNINYLIYLYAVLTKGFRLSDPRMAIMTGLTFASLLVRGTRTTIIFLAMVYVIWTVVRARRFRVFIALLPVIVIFFMALTTFFRYDYNLERLLTYFSRGFFVDFDNIRHVNYITGHIDRWGYQLGKTLTDAWQYFIPRSLWPGKPYSTFHSRLLYPHIARVSTTNYTIGIIGTSYLNFGWIGVLVEHTVLSFIYCLVFDKLLSTFRNGRMEVAYCYIVSMVYAAILFVNDGILNKNIAQVVLWIVALRLFFWLSRKTQGSLRCIVRGGLNTAVVEDPQI